MTVNRGTFFFFFLGIEKPATGDGPSSFSPALTAPLTGSCLPSIYVVTSDSEWSHHSLAILHVKY